jgi:NTE family protein
MLRLSPTPRSPLSLALQGGGAHGAFTWGVLDALLERGVPLAGLSGASAGAVNAALVAHGLNVGGHDGARTALERFWLSMVQGPPITDRAVPMAQAMMQWTRWFTPTQLNPFGINPLRDALRAQIDFERLQRTPGPDLFVATTEADTGRLRLFTRRELTLGALLASACLPTIAHPVWIDGRALWDGAFSANPPLWPLVRHTAAADLLLVTLSPLAPVPLPDSADGIQARVIEIAMTATFLREARALAEQQADAQTRWLRLGLDRRLARLRWHLISGDDALAGLPGHTRWLPQEPLVLNLRERGREHAAAWWAAHAHALGQRSSIDPMAVFGPTQAPTA